MERSPKRDELEDSLPASLTVTRTSERDIKQRQLIVSVDGGRVATLLFRDSVTRLGFGTYPMLFVLGVAPLYVTVNRMN